MGNNCWKSKDPGPDSPDAGAARGPAAGLSDAGRIDKYVTDERTEPLPSKREVPMESPLHPGSAVLCVVGVGHKKFLTGGEDGRLCFGDYSKESLVAVGAKETHSDDLRRLYFNAKRSLAASSSRDTTIKTWKVTDDGVAFLHTFSGHTMPVMNSCMNDDGSRMFSGSRDNSVRLWDLGSGQQIKVKTVARNLVHSMAWLDDNVVVQGGENLKLYLWDVRGDKLDTHGEAITGVPDQPVCMTRDPFREHHVYVGYKGFTAATAVLRLWDIRMKKEVVKFTGHNKCVVDIAFAGNRMGSSAHDGTIVLWDRVTGEEQSCTQLSLEGSPTDFTLIDNQALVSTTEGELAIYDYKDDATLFALERLCKPT